MNRFILFFASILLVVASTGQSNESLLKEAAGKLSSGQSSVSDILTSTVYASLHHQADFRELVKEYANTEKLEIAPAGETGKRIKVIGKLVDTNGDPLPGVLIYLYQTDARGWYAADRPHVGGNEGDRKQARLFAYLKTGTDGMFELHTIKPSGYPMSELPAHIHIEILEVPGFRPFITEFLFDDDERLVGTVREAALRNRFIISKPGKSSPPFEQQFSYTISLNR